MRLAKNNQGQSLIELIVAIAIIEIGLFSVWSLFLVNFNAEREAEMRIVGVNLSREGLEAIKNIRDSNWLKSANNLAVLGKTDVWSWDQNLSPGTYAVNYDSQAPEDIVNHENIYIDNLTGFFTVDGIGNKPTPFQRKIILKNICCDDLDGNLKCDAPIFNNNDDADCQLKAGVSVVSVVSWQISGHLRSATIEDNLYDWK